MQTAAASAEPRGRQPVLLALSPLLLAVLAAFLIVGIGLPVLPLYVHRALGFDTFTVGLVTGSQFVASLLSRPWAGRTVDQRGAKRAVMTGLGMAVGAGLLYLLSAGAVSQSYLSVACLLAGRALLGGAESFIMTGSTVWGMSRVGPDSAGKVIAWIGTAMFGAMAGGAPLGVMLYDRGGFATVAAVTLVAPLVPVLLVAPIRLVPPAGARRPSMLAVARRIWLPGLGAALASIGFGAILAFGSLLFADRNWTPVWLPFTAYAAALIVARLFLGHLPDRVGGARVALICVLVEAAGLALMGLAGTAAVAAAGAALTGLGYALVFPGLGIEAVRRAPPESRGLAMGAYTGCLDLAIGVSGPLLGLLSTGAGLGAVFVASAVAVLASVLCAARLMREDAAVPEVAPVR